MAISVFKNVIGRSADLVWFRNDDGTMVYLHHSQIVEFYVPGLQKLQFIQTSFNSFVLKVIIKDDSIIKEVYDEMKTILKGHGLEEVVSFSVQIADRIENDPKTGKYKLIIPYKE